MGTIIATSILTSLLTVFLQQIITRRKQNKSFELYQMLREERMKLGKAGAHLPSQQEAKASVS